MQHLDFLHFIRLPIEPTYNNMVFCKYLKIGNEETVSILCKKQKVEISNVYDLAVDFGHISIFSLLVLTLFEAYNISNINELKNNKNVRDILSDESINKWIKRCDNDNIAGMHSFLLQLNENALKTEKFGLITSYLYNASSNISDDNNNNNVSSSQLKKGTISCERMNLLLIICLQN